MKFLQNLPDWLIVVLIASAVFPLIKRLFWRRRTEDDRDLHDRLSNVTAARKHVPDEIRKKQAKRREDFEATYGEVDE